MDVKLMSSKISLSGGSFNDFVEKILHEDEDKQTKTASVEKVAEEEEAETSGQPQAEAKLVNEPEQEEGTAGGACNEEAETSGQPQAEAKLVNHPKVEADEEATVKTAEEDSDEPFGGKQAEPFKKKEDCDSDDDGEKEDKEDEKEDEKEAKSINFVKIAKLNSKTKQMLLTYWSQLYPAEYAQAMVEEQ